MGVLRKTNGESKIDSKSLNDVIILSKRILKILFVVIIIAGIYGLTILLKELGIIAFFIELLEIVAPLFIGIVIAWLFNPIMKKLEKKGVRRGLGAALIYFILIILIVLIFKAIIPLMFGQINEFVNGIPSILNDLTNWLNSLFSKVGNSPNVNIDSFKTELLVKIEDYGMSLANNLPTIMVNALKTGFSGIGTVLVGFVIGFFLLTSFDGTDKIMTFLPEKFRKNTKTLFNNIESALRKFVQGTLTLSTLVFLVSSLGFAISGLKSSLVFGLFCGIANIIPYVGPYVGAAPAVLVGFTQGPAVGIGVLVTVILVQVIEGNILNPIVMSKTMKLHPVTIILGLLIFGHFWGIVGMILATPLIATGKIIFEYFDKKYDLLNRRKKQIVEED